jgi:hypothetical protein
LIEFPEIPPLFMAGHFLIGLVGAYLIYRDAERRMSNLSLEWSFAVLLGWTSTLILGVGAVLLYLYHRRSS